MGGGGLRGYGMSGIQQRGCEDAVMVSGKQLGKTGAGIREEG